MRTTITLTPEADALVRRVMRERGLSFKDAVNAAILEGLAPRRRERYTTPVRSLGRPLLPLDKALQLAGDLEDEELLRKHALGK